MKISISVEGAFGCLDWPRWQRLIMEIEALGFAGIFLADHFDVRQSFPAWASLPLTKLFEAMRAHISLVVGMPAEVVERLRAYEAVDVSEMLLQWGGMGDWRAWSCSRNMSCLTFRSGCNRGDGQRGAPLAIPSDVSKACKPGGAL